MNGSSSTLELEAALLLGKMLTITKKTTVNVAIALLDMVLTIVKYSRSFALIVSIH